MIHLPRETCPYAVPNERARLVVLDSLVLRYVHGCTRDRLESADAAKAAPQAGIGLKIPRDLVSCGFDSHLRHQVSNDLAPARAFTTSVNLALLWANCARCPDPRDLRGLGRRRSLSRASLASPSERSASLMILYPSKTERVLQPHNDMMTLYRRLLRFARVAIGECCCRLRRSQKAPVSRMLSAALRRGQYRRVHQTKRRPWEKRSPRNDFAPRVPPVEWRRLAGCPRDGEPTALPMKGGPASKPGAPTHLRSRQLRCGTRRLHREHRGCRLHPIPEARRRPDLQPHDHVALSLVAQRLELGGPRLCSPSWKAPWRT